MLVRVYWIDAFEFESTRNLNRKHMQVAIQTEGTWAGPIDHHLLIEKITSETIDGKTIHRKGKKSLAIPFSLITKVEPVQRGQVSQRRVHLPFKDRPEAKIRPRRLLLKQVPPRLFYLGKIRIGSLRRINLG